MTTQNDKTKLNLFGTVLTYAAPSSNYHGESELNRTVIQRITRDSLEYGVVSPEAMRNALREILAGYGLSMNRRRLEQEDQLAVEFKSFPDAAKFADDFLFGFLVADQDAVKKNKGKPAKRDSVLRMNLAVALNPYRFNATFHQSPMNAGDSPWKNSSTSALLHREVSDTAFQYPFALAMQDCSGSRDQKEWTAKLLKAIGELTNVAGGHARSYFEFAPRSIIMRLSPQLVAGYQTYAFTADGKFAEMKRITKEAKDLPPKEFWFGGEVVRQLDKETRDNLAAWGAHLNENPQALLAEVSEEALGVKP
ncbi:MAG: type I-B CRISPR-associated protein Cas7/Cst2/DevR [Deltaproteobacteria bacterium]|nr:type I-B CRISPR-associated protein Cas7/Cst2/DevR [Deltaproteobacteria bacterium]